MIKYTNNKFFCFSPPVMVATFLIEISMVLYMFIRYKMTPVTRTVVALLTLLALFQFAEYNVCANSDIGTRVWARLGFVAISFLPILSLQLVYLLIKRRTDNLLKLAYFNVFVFMAVLIWPTTLGSSYCGSNYAMFNVDNLYALNTYIVYYFGWIIVGVTICANNLNKVTKRTKRALSLQLLGYASFIIPTAITTIIRPAALQGIPSVMCGFAVIYAFIIVFGIVPAIHTPQKSQ